MNENSNKEIFTIGVGGAAGEGVKKTGMNIGSLLHDLGEQIYMSSDYPSLIRGGHNFIRMSVGKEVVHNDYAKLDILVALNEETITLHKAEMKTDGQVISGLALPEILEKIKNIFNEKNVQASAPKGELLDGNTAFAKGLQSAGLDFYIAYPMTPSTSILHYLASKQTREGLKVIQPENEISVINMALGMAYAGKRVAVGSATGGFALMQEAFSFAGIAELPLVVAVSQRQAPATGAPTHSSQSDLRFVIHAGHGEFPRIVICPGDPEEAFKAGTLALNLAWQFQVPLIVLLDKILSEHMMSTDIDTNLVSIERGKLAQNPNSEYGRYEVTLDGVSPMAFPGTVDTVVKVTSYEHNQAGITTEKSEEIKKMLDKRFAKMESIKSQMLREETVKVYGDEGSDKVVVFFGSTKGPVLEASKYFKKPVKLLQIIWLEPFDVERVKKELLGKNIICVEGNHNGQLASLIREKTGIEIAGNILRYDSRPFDPLELAEDINKVWN